MTEPAVPRAEEATTHRGYHALVLILLAAAGLRFIALDALALIGDESYYWLWSRHPAWSYYDHPAGVALLIRASTALAGSTAFGVRWLNALVGVACVFLTWLVGQRLVSHRAGLLSAAAVAVGAPYLITSRFVYTNALTLALMLLNLLTFWRMTRTDTGIKEAAACGLTLALLFNTKYNAYAYALALAAAVLLDHRGLLRTSRPWVAALIGSLGLLPVGVWNATHDWASFRWQLSHLTQSAVHDASMVGSVHHAWTYLTGPLVLLGLVGLGRHRTSGERLLTLIALFLLVPIVSSPINSPRNLSTGMVPLLILAGSRLPDDVATWSRRARVSALGLLLSGLSVFGVGTIVGLGRPTALPQSSIVPAIRRDAAGWQAIGASLESGSEPIFALDYSIAGQIRYYADRPCFTAWEQYRLWGIPSLEDVTVVALDYVDPQYVTQRLQEAFQRLEGPERLTFTERDVTKVVHIWRARDLRWDKETFLRRFDFLTLLKETS